MHESDDASVSETIARLSFQNAESVTVVLNLFGIRALVASVWNLKKKEKHFLININLFRKNIHNKILVLLIFVYFWTLLASQSWSCYKRINDINRKFQSGPKKALNSLIRKYIKFNVFFFRNSASALAPLVFIQIVPFVQRFSANYISPRRITHLLGPKVARKLKIIQKRLSFRHKIDIFSLRDTSMQFTFPSIEGDQIKRFHSPQRRTDDSKRQPRLHFHTTSLMWWKKMQ